MTQKPNKPDKPHVRQGPVGGPALPPPRQLDEDITFEKVTVNDVPRWMWRTPGGHGVLAPRDPRIVEGPDGRGVATAPLSGFSVGVLNLRDQFGIDKQGKMFQYTLTAGWTDGAPTDDAVDR